MELNGILKDAIATRGHGSDGAVESLKYRMRCLISKDYEDKDCMRYVKQLKLEGLSLFTFIMNDVEYHNNVSVAGADKVRRIPQDLVRDTGPMPVPGEPRSS